MKKWLIILLSFLVLVLLVGIYGLVKPVPKNVGFAGTVHQLKPSSLHFFSDTTFLDENGIRQSDQQIFDEIFRMIADAQEYILVDMFLFNDFTGTETESYRQLSSELTEKLVAKKKENPNIKIQVITDPINSFYGGYDAPQLKTLTEHNIAILTTDLRPLRDSNPLYSAWWRTFFQWLGNSPRPGIFPNPLQANGQRLSLRTYLAIFNYKANHRKIVVADYEKENAVGLATLITSANPHDGSSAHSNVAVRVDDYLWQDALTTEKAVAQFSKKEFIEPSNEFLQKIKPEPGTVATQLLTEKAIKEKIISLISELKENNTLDMAMFYIADRDIVKALKKADARGAKIRILLDPNKDAFGREKNGIPNRQVAHELFQNSSGNTELRWCDTHGEQCHSKMLLFNHGDKKTLVQGSANLTRRNLENFNLETNVLISTNEEVPVVSEASNFFEEIWNNEDNKKYSAEYSAYEDASKFRTATYRLKEFLGTNRW